MSEPGSTNDSNDPASLAARDASGYPADRFGITVQELQAIVQCARGGNAGAEDETRE